MRSWEAASDRIRQRAAPTVIGSIVVDSPFLFDPAHDHSDVPDFLEGEWDRFHDRHDTVIDLPGRDLNLTRDCLIAASKFFHVVECARQARARGSLTWTLVDAYHAALLGTRAIAAFYGVLSYTVKRRTLLIDYRPASGKAEDTKKFRRAHRDLSSPIRVLKPEKTLLEQKDAWLLLKRLANITEDVGDEKVRAGSLAQLAALSLSATRNFILYDSVHWTWREDFSKAPISPQALVSRFASGDSNVQELLSSLTVMYRAVSTYSEGLCKHIGFDFADLPHAVALGADEPALR